MKIYILHLTLAAFLLSSPLIAQNNSSDDSKKKESESDKKDPWKTETFKGLNFRCLGTAKTSGRVIDFAVNPNNSNEYYVAAASGGVWKTSNHGITYTPVFENEGSYSIGCVNIDPNNSNVVWVGTGENNNQRSVAYGDGLYKSEDGGKSWKNMGLKNSEHIGMIVIDPNNSDIVYVAAYGPLWSAGGDRGIYKTIDGGKTWKNILSVSENTGFNEVHMDPRNSNVLYATSHQRRRQVYTYISGGPESNIYKSFDGGATWDTLKKGLPEVDKGRIGLAISPANPDYIYAIIEASDKKGGVYRSTNRGASWDKMSDNVTAGNYYQEIFCDPKDVDKVFYVDLWVMVSKDGGKTFSKIGEKYKHVDNHALWIDDKDTKHLLVGCDGGVYETYDFGTNWEFKANLPITQFYKVAVDNSYPFYWIYGGTQDNNSLGVPSRTISANGITNADWIFTLGGDGYETQIDPENPDIIYPQYQYGGLSRFDKKSGETVDIRPVEGENEPALRWNWDSPLLISTHKHTRLYCGANKLFRTDDMGNSWTAISGDLSRQIDRNNLPVMGRVWSMDAVAKNASTDIYGQLVSIAESYFDENHLVVGTDDGLIQVTKDGGKSWSKVDNIAGVPERTYVNQIIPSHHDKNVFYATFNHHRYGNFKPYVYKSTDGGMTWAAIQGNLPERGSVYTIAEDHVNKDLLFAGTEFGVFFTIDGGTKWTQLKGGLPTIAVRDIAIQTRENDLVLATFGRGYYILDDYTPLRTLKKEDLAKEAFISPVKDSWMFIESTTAAGGPQKGFQGESYYSAPNPKVGAVFTYYLKDNLKTMKEKRQEMEKERIKKNEPVYYPSADSIRLEDQYPEPYLLFTITDDAGAIVRKIKTAAKKGLSRLVWDMRYASPGPVNFHTPDPTNPYDQDETGHLAMAGTYKVSLSKFENGKTSELVPAQSFIIKSLNAASLPAPDKKSLDTFCKKVSELRRATGAADAYLGELKNKIKFIKSAMVDVQLPQATIAEQVYNIENRLTAADIKMNGDASLAKREFETLPSINGRIGTIESTLWTTTSAPTQTAVNSYDIASKQFDSLLPELKSIDEEIKNVESTLEKNRAPFTPGRLPEWKK
ncbi:MAG TPA: glycosyl hydrolase [Bacteroidia bacterium]|nr:glycosyl hydrolase [Bacteroidia bacterium]